MQRSQHVFDMDPRSSHRHMVSWFRGIPSRDEKCFQKIDDYVDGKVKFIIGKLVFFVDKLSIIVGLDDIEVHLIYYTSNQ